MITNTQPKPNTRQLPKLLGSEVGSLHMSLPGATHTARQFKLQLQMLEAQAELASSPQHSAPLKQAPAPRCFWQTGIQSRWELAAEAAVGTKPDYSDYDSTTSTSANWEADYEAAYSAATQVRMLQQMLLDPGHLTVTLV